MASYRPRSWASTIELYDDFAGATRLHFFRLQRPAGRSLPKIAPSGLRGSRAEGRPCLLSWISAGSGLRGEYHRRCRGELPLSRASSSGHLRSSQRKA